MLNNKTTIWLSVVKIDLHLNLNVSRKNDQHWFLDDTDLVSNVIMRSNNQDEVTLCLLFVSFQK